MLATCVCVVIRADHDAAFNLNTASVARAALSNRIRNIAVRLRENCVFEWCSVVHCRANGATDAPTALLI